MAYEGYRIKINGVIIRNDMIAKGSYAFRRGCRVLASYYDATGRLHEEKSPHKSAVINFTIRERSAEEHKAVMAAFEVRDEVTVVYWDDEASAYQTAVCKINDLNIAHLSTYGGNIQYAGMPVTIEEY